MASAAPSTPAFRAEGLPAVDDINTTGGEGVAPVPLNGTSQRYSSASAYLTAQVRARPNFTLLANRVVRGVLFDGRKVSGIQLEGLTKTKGVWAYSAPLI